MYQVSEKKAKCKVRFFGKWAGADLGLNGISLEFFEMLYNLPQQNVLNLLMNKEDGNIYATISVCLMQDQIIGTKEIADKTIVVKRTGNTGNYSAEILKKQESGDLIKTYSSKKLETNSFDSFFSGNALIFSFDKVLEDGKKYFIKTSWGLSNNNGGRWHYPNSRYTNMYKLNTKNQDDKNLKKVWTLSDMIKSDPDINNNGVMDQYDYTPSVTTTVVSDVTKNTATCGGNVTDEGSADVTAKGVCWGTSPNPEITDSHTTDGKGIGAFTSSITGLTKNTTYYIRAYATSEIGTSYANNQQSITTSAELPTLSTNTVSDITETTAISGGNITNDGGATITTKGICWGTSPNPITANSKTNDGAGTAPFTSSITALTANTTYYVRAYATNSAGTAYSSNEESFTTNAAIGYPSVSILNVTGITETTATTGGLVNSDGGAAVTAKGVCWSTSQNPTTANSKTNDGTGTDSYISSLTGLTAGTSYYVRAYATNSVGTAYSSNQGNFTTNTQASGLATVSTNTITSVTETTATSGGSITDDGATAITAKGVCWSTSNDPTIADYKTSNGAGTSAFASSLTGLTHSTSYYVRAYATNSTGTAYGNQQAFTTLVYNLPSITTNAVTDKTETTATSGGNITDDGGAEVTLRGICWSTSPNPTAGDSHTDDGIGIGLYISSITGLAASTTYYVRAYAYNAAGIVYADNELSFTTTGGNQTGTLTDYDGNTYNTIKIGNQWWMAENLKTTHYANGTAIPLVTDNTAWKNLGDNNTDKAYCYYNNNANNEADTYGALYTYAAATNGDNDGTTQGVCPTGWHLPSDVEWKELEMYLGMSQNEADATASRGTNEGSKLAGNAALWIDGNLETNAKFGTSSFTALPGGNRLSYNGAFYYLGNYGFWWSATEYNGTTAWERLLDYNYSYVNRTNYDKSSGYSVRCLQD